MEARQYAQRQGLTNALIVAAVSIAWFAYHKIRKKVLAQELKLAHAKLQYLQEQLQQPGENQVRIFMDGAFDLLHFGHMNAFRLARSLGTHLVVGVNSDESIAECKGQPLMSDDERLTMVSSCKFVDEVIPGCPYIMNKEYLEYVIEKYNIDYVVHGDDPCIVDGKDVYATAKEAGKYRSIPRTEGVSTTNIVGRMLLMTKEHHFHSESEPAQTESEKANGTSLPLLSQQSTFLTTSRMLQLFSAGVRAPTKEMRVVYIDGAWDMFHPGHVAILKAARERGDYLLVGIHGDAVVNQVRGMNLPLMNLHERVLSVLGCRFVDDVLIDAPYDITKEMIASLHLSAIVWCSDDEFGEVDDEEVRFRHAKEAGILACVERPSSFRVENIIQRIRRNQETFEARFERKMASERRFYDEKHNRNGNKH